jgi:hypothetical protein
MRAGNRKEIDAGRIVGKGDELNHGVLHSSDICDYRVGGKFADLAA